MPTPSAFPSNMSTAASRGSPRSSTSASSSRAPGSICSPRMPASRSSATSRRCRSASSTRKASSRRAYEVKGQRRHALARIFALSGGFRLLVGHDLAEGETLRPILWHALITSLIWLTVIGTIGGLIVARQRAAPRRCDRGRRAPDRRRRSLRAPASRRHRRRARSSRREPQRHAGPHRRAGGRHEGSVGQRRARSEDAADAPAQPRRAERCAAKAVRSRTIATPWRR